MIELIFDDLNSEVTGFGKPVTSELKKIVVIVAEKVVVEKKSKRKVQRVLFCDAIGAKVGRRVVLVNPQNWWYLSGSEFMPSASLCD